MEYHKILEYFLPSELFVQVWLHLSNYLLNRFQYTSYSQQLASQIESLTHQLNDRGQEIHHLATREKDLVAHVQQLEGQLQKLIQVRNVLTLLSQRFPVLSEIYFCVRTLPYRWRNVARSYYYSTFLTIL